MKILLYGGCHALVLRDLLRDLVDPAAVELSLLINFQLIESGQPFPYERVEWCDVLIYSPIENKGEYNTDVLLERSCASTKLVLCFPWMEWHGYCPGAVKGTFKGRFQWFYPRLLELVEYFDTFESFVMGVCTHFPPDDVIDRTFAESSEKLASSEERHRTPIRISDFITANFRASRLFLISDHPARSLYLHVLRQIFEQLGLRMHSEPAAAEPQWRWRTPIFPRVAERLGLAFADPTWVDDELVPGCVSSLESYLSLYFYKDSVILGPRDDGEILFGIDGPMPVDAETRFVASLLGRDEKASLDAYVCLETLSRSRVVLEPRAKFAIDTKQWRSTWSF